MTDFNTLFNWCEPDANAAEHYNEDCSQLFWKMFDHQENWVHMFGELGEGRNPQVKSFKEYHEQFNDAWNEVYGMKKGHTLMCMLLWYAADDIDMDEDSEWELREYWDIPKDQSITEFAKDYFDKQMNF